MQIMTADIIYHLFDKFKKYIETYKESKKSETAPVFPVVLEIDRRYIFNRNNPILIGCKVKGGQLRIGTPLCVPDKNNLVIGHVAGIQKDRKPVKISRTGEDVCVKIEQKSIHSHIAFGRHFDESSPLYSLITRESIDVLKEHFRSEMASDDWDLLKGLKEKFQIP